MHPMSGGSLFHIIRRYLLKVGNQVIRTGAFLQSKHTSVLDIFQ